MAKTIKIYAVACVLSMAAGWYGTGWLLANAPAEVATYEGGR